MAKFSRVEIHKSAEIPAPAVEVWGLISDWAGMLRWWLTAEEGGLQGPAALVKCELVGEPNGIPRTRRMFLGNGAVAEEQVFYQNDESRRIYYTKSADQDVTGYVASTYVDESGGAACTVHVSAQFDVREEAGVTAVTARFEAIYAAMFRGYQRYFSHR